MQNSVSCFMLAIQLAAGAH